MLPYRVISGRNCNCILSFYAKSTDILFQISASIYDVRRQANNNYKLATSEIQLLASSILAPIRVQDKLKVNLVGFQQRMLIYLYKSLCLGYFYPLIFGFVFIW